MSTSRTEARFELFGALSSHLMPSKVVVRSSYFRGINAHAVSNRSIIVARLNTWGHAFRFDQV